MTRRYIPSEDLLERLRAGEGFAAARLISRAEAGMEEARPTLGAIYRAAGRAHVVGITGVPGSGKSTLVGRLVTGLRAAGKRVAIVAIDPSSPYSGGSILGDRIRMSEHAMDEGVFIRSMATRGAVGGMAHAALDVVDILDVAGFDIVLIETVGVGQDEVEIASASDTTVVVSAPGLGDEVQAIKAGILEIADIHVVSKCDRSDANRTMTDLKMMLKDQPLRDDGWRPPVIGLSSFTGEGFEALGLELSRHRTALEGPGGIARRRAIAAFRLKKTAETLALERLRLALAALDADVSSIAERRSDPYSRAAALVDLFTGETS
ncbi:MAG: methylmalonyl Co-A mutase-associated GTPase MeaB [Rhodobacteraceae bacterium]|nr:methylmalonyl Co-A mutase-associated GTPase MeaB [Paracoccaceae bacterium]